MNTDGTIDLNFNIGIGPNSTVRSISMQSDNKIVIGGDFTSYNVINRNYVARLNSDGTLDATFASGLGANNSVRTTTFQSDGKIIIGGDFTSFNGVVRSNIAMLNPDGLLDSIFNMGSGTNESVWTTSIQSDGKIIIGGDFTSYNGTGRNRIARIFGGTNTVGSLKVVSNHNFIYPNPFSLMATLKSDHLLKNASLSLYNVQGEVVLEINNIYGEYISLFRDKLSCGFYLIQLTENNKLLMSEKLVVSD